MLVNLITIAEYDCGTGTVRRTPTYTGVWFSVGITKQVKTLYPYHYGGDSSMPGFFAALALFVKELMLLVSYVKNNAFPQPLSEKEEERHLRQMAAGNMDSRNKLIEHNLRLVAHIVNTL